MTVHFIIICMPHILTNGWLFNFPENEVLQMTVELFSGREDIQTCLSISAPAHLLPMNVYVIFNFPSAFLNFYHQ